MKDSLFAPRVQILSIYQGRPLVAVLLIIDAQHVKTTNVKFVSDQLIQILGMEQIFASSKKLEQFLVAE